MVSIRMLWANQSVNGERRVRCGLWLPSSESLIRSLCASALISDPDPITSALDDAEQRHSLFPTHMGRTLVFLYSSMGRVERAVARVCHMLNLLASRTYEWKTEVTQILGRTIQMRTVIIRTMLDWWKWNHSKAVQKKWPTQILIASESHPWA